ncbi:uncharacterized protein LOC113681727 [Pocillopora damicornis]|uniref:uncharacterized protein LOC113681727 n=1 Tax=Pocillopora damicornis TaxID=46731 RepID=UPI000F54EB87|nr:uncharacterized protein LOC113681727 [Pocillopora damicornis]
MKRVNYCTTLVQWIFTVYFLSQAIMATAGAVCLDSTDTFAVNSGVNASLPFNASNDENLNDFRVYRAQKNSMEFAHMTKDKSKGDCSGSLSDLCVKGKVEFRRDNQTHLLLVEIFHTTINDSGQYAVWAKFNSGNLHPDEKTAKCLKVIHVKVEGNSTETTTSPFPQSTQVYSPSSSSETTSPAPQSTQVYSPSSSSGKRCQGDYSLTVNASGDIIIVMRNISDPYFGSYLISVYRKSDDKIDTLWIKVYKKEFLLRDRSPTAMTPTVFLPHVSHTHTKDHVTTEENKPSEQPKSNGTMKNHISRPTLAYNGKEKAVQSGWRIPVLAISTGCLYRLLLIEVSWYKSTWENKI